MPPNIAPARGITSQPSVSMNLMRADTIPAGSAIWAESDDDVWVLAEVVRQENTLLTVRRKTTGEEMEIDLVREEERRVLVQYREPERYNKRPNENEHIMWSCMQLTCSRRARVAVGYDVAGRTCRLRLIPDCFSVA